MVYLSGVGVSVGKDIEPNFIFEEKFIIKMNFNLNKDHKVLTISERFLLIRKEFSLTAGRLGEIAGVTGTAIAKIESGDTVNPKADVLSQISTKLQINLNWLLLGEGEMLKPTESPRKIFVTPELPIPSSNPGTSGGFSKNPPVHRARPVEALQLVEKVPSIQRNSASQGQSVTIAGAESGSHSQTQAQSDPLLTDVKAILLRYVSFEARASFFEELRQNIIRDDFETVPHRLASAAAEASYADAVVFEIEERTMEPSLRYGQQVIAWPIAESKWGYLHNTICIVAYDETVAVKAIRTNELFDRDGLTLHATSGSGGSFTVARKNIHSIWEANEFYGYVPVLLLS